MKTTEFFFYDTYLLIGDFKFPDNVKRILFLFKRVNRETTALYRCL